jgi:hypothetical protein
MHKLFTTLKCLKSWLHAAYRLPLHFMLFNELDVACDGSFAQNW